MYSSKSVQWSISLSIYFQFSTRNKACLERQCPLTKKITIKKTPAVLPEVVLPYLTHACEFPHLQIPTALQFIGLGGPVILKFLKTAISSGGRSIAQRFFPISLLWGFEAASSTASITYLPLSPNLHKRRIRESLRK